MRSTPIAVLVLTAALACADAPPDPPAGGRGLVIATLYPLTSLTRAVGGNAVEVRTLLPAGVHADTYEARPRDAESIAAADLLVRAGGAADSWVGEPGGVPTLVFADGMRLIADDGHGGGNPHVWLDPIRVRDHFLPRLTAALVGVAPDSADAIRRRSAAFADSLSRLDAEIRALLADTRTRRFVSAHPTWTYFADRYDLIPAGVIHASPGAEPGTRGLARLVDAARESGVRAIIAEPQLARAGAEALAAELDARVETADPVGGEGLEARDDYLSLMRFNARAFARALGDAGARQAGSP